MHADYQTGAGAMPHGVVTDPHVFVAIAPDGLVTHHRRPRRHGHRPAAPRCR